MPRSTSWKAKPSCDPPRVKPWWQVLDVPRGSDRATIRRAYAAKLKSTNPEDDPAGFMALRAAYEAALRRVDDDDDWYDPDAEDVPIASGPEPVAPETRPEPEPSPIAAARPDRDPGEAARVREAAEFDRLKHELEAGLRGPWFKSREALQTALDALLDAPAMMEVDRRDATEYWLAGLIADTIPRGDAILKRAMAEFGWEGEGNHPQAVWQIRARHDEWRLISSFQDSKHPLGAGWRALTDGPMASWRRRLGAMRPGLVAQVRQLFELAEYEVPGIRHSFHPAAAKWWTGHLEAPRFGFSELAMLLLGALGAILFAQGGATPLAQTAGAAGSALAGAGFALFHWRRGRVRDEPARGFGWRIGLWLAAVATFIGAPMQSWIASTAILIAPAAAAAILVLDREERDADMSWKRLAALAFLGALGAAGFATLTIAEQAALLGFAVSCGMIALSVPARLGRMLGPWPIPSGLGAVALLILGAVVRSDGSPGASHLLPWMVAGGTGLLLMSALRTRDPDGRDGAVATLAIWGLWVVLIFAAALAAPETAESPPPVPIVSTDPMAGLEAAEPGFRRIKTGNPELYAQIKGIRGAIAAGERSAADGSRAIDRLVNAAYQTRIVMARAPLIAAEMEIRLAQFREFQANDPAACVGEAGGSAPPQPSEALRKRHYRHALMVAASAAATEERARGRAIPMAELLRSAAGGDAVRARGLEDAMKGTNLSRKCAARIAVLEALTAHSDDDIAKTMRPALIAQAAQDSKAKK